MRDKGYPAAGLKAPIYRTLGTRLRGKGFFAQTNHIKQ